MRNCNIYIWLLGLLLFVGCATDEEPVTPVNPPTGSDVMTLTLKFPQSSVTTKALSAEEENRVDLLDVLVFKKATAPSNFLDDILAYRIQIPASGITSTTSAVDGDTKKVNIKVRNMEEQQRIILLANLPAGTLSVTDTAVGKTLREILPKLTFNGTSWLKDNISGSDAAFPMWGQMASPEYALFYHTNLTPPTSVTINMIRAVARIDIGVNIGGFSDPALGFGDIFKIDKVYLCNTNRDGNITPHITYLEEEVDSVRKDKVYVPNPITTNKVNMVEYDFKVNDSNDSTMLRTIYTMESDTLKSGNDPAFLIVKARYYDQDSYYRIDFADNGKYKALLRNHRYTINIVGARTSGYATLTEALASKPSLLNPALIFDIAEVELKASVTNEQYLLAYSTDEVKVDWNGTTRFYVRTDYPGGWKATGAVTASGNANALEYFDIDFSAGTDWNMTGQPIKRTIQLSAGTLKKEITVIQSGGSNSYVIRTGETLKIPLSSADMDGRLINGQKVSDLIRRVSATWNNGTHASALLNLSQKYVNVTMSSASTGGNVLVEAYDANNNLIWSWLVWTVPIGVDFEKPEYQRSNNGYIFMDRNLGAHHEGETSYGNFYQWGRKDPLPFDFGYQTSFTDRIRPVVYSNNLDTALCNPKSFYTNTNSPYDWIGTDAVSQSNSLWTTVDGEKGVYDPCPFGWRVPVVTNEADSPWKGFTSNRWNNAVYPLSGGGAFSTGLYTSDRGTQGYLWSASARGSNAIALTFSMSSASHIQAFRANAYPIRCVKDVKR